VSVFFTHYKLLTSNQIKSNYISYPIEINMKFFNFLIFGILYADLWIMDAITCLLVILHIVALIFGVES